MNIIDNNTIFCISTLIIILIFLIRIPVMCKPKSFTYQYSAKTRFSDKDHTYIFNNKLMKNGCYRCYIERSPFLFGKRFSRYTIDYGYDEHCGKCYILSNRKIHDINEAKELCAEWSNFNQYVIDSKRNNY